MMLRRLVNMAVLLTLAILAATSLRAQSASKSQGELGQGLQADVKIFNKLDQILIRDPIGNNPSMAMKQRYGLSNLLTNEYGSTVFVSSATGCTAVLIGPRVLLTARHCTPGDSIEFGATKMGAKCTRLRDLDGQPVLDEEHDDDVSLCLTADRVPGPYETVGFDPSFVAVGKELVLSGYGLTGKPSVKVGDALNLGLAKVTRSNLDTFPVELVSEGSALDVGDSGGGVFYVPKGTTRRFVVGVNKKLTPKTGVSYLTPLAGQHIKALVEKWRTTAEKGNKIQIGICGVAGFSTDCRQ